MGSDDSARADLLSPARRALLELWIRGSRPTSSVAAAPVEARPRIAPASHAQQRLWFLEQLQQEQVPYTLHSVQHITWSVDPALLERAVNEIVRRHEVLRTTFELKNGEPCQRIAPAAHIPLDTVDLREVADAERRTEATRRIASVLARRMDLERGPLLRTALYRLDGEEWLFLVSVHHIVFDGPSFPVFFSELRAAYDALASGRDPYPTQSPAQYSEFALRQQAALTPERVAREVEFWREELAGLSMLDLPLDRRRPAVPTFRGALHKVAIPPDVTLALQQLAGAQNATLFMVLLAGLAAALSRVCAQEDFAVGLPATGRDAPELGNAIGFFVDTVVVRCHVTDDPTIEELIARIRTALSRSLTHRLLPFDMLVEHLRPARDLSVNPLFQVGFQLVQGAQQTDNTGAFDVPRTGAMFDLGLDLWPEGQWLGGRLEFNTDLFDRPTIEGITGAFEQTLRSMLDPRRRVSELSISAGGARTSQSVLRGDTVDWGDPSVLDLLHAQATAAADAVALEAPGTSLTYGELVTRAARLGSALARAGVSPRSWVALVLPRSADLVCLQLACWHCGAGFVSLDPSWPESRRASALADIQPSLIVTPEIAAEIRLEEGAEVLPRYRAKEGEGAYAIFTSGTTGAPKAVVLEHAGLLNVAMAQRRIFGTGCGRRIAQLASPTFDASVFETVLALGSGATLVVAPPDTLAGEELAEFLRQRNIDGIVVPPSLLATMRPSDCAQLQLVCVAGESCSTDLAEQWQRGRDFWNLYGPTETTIWATYGRGSAGARVAIGHPIPNTSTMVVDRNGRPVPVGIAGELWVGGAGVAKGYVNRPELTSARFLTDPTDARRRMYRTGDLVRQLYDGSLVFLGRIDRQVKVRGFRIEPEEIESILRRHPSVTDAVVEAKLVSGGEPTLVAYLQCAIDPAPIDECRQLIAEHLPQYMMPGRWLALREFPRTASSKIDRGALPLPDVEQTSDYIEPATPTERRVAELMAHVARVSRIGASDDFFHIGGHSLAVAELVSRIRATFKVDIVIRDVFAHPTVSALATRVDQLAAARDSSVTEEDVPLVRLPRRHERAPASAHPARS